jgi:RNA polymerase sigma-70 factor (ECF subfamily)
LYKSTGNGLKSRTEITKLSNDELFDLCKKEEQATYFDELYRRYIPMVYGLCLKYLSNEADAQDAVMDLFEDVSQ